MRASAYVIGEEVPDMAKGFFELTLVATPIVALVLAGLVGGTALGMLRTGVGRRWFMILSGAMCIVHVVSGVSFAHSGFVLTRCSATADAVLTRRVAGALGDRNP